MNKNNTQIASSRRAAVRTAGVLSTGLAAIVLAVAPLRAQTYAFSTFVGNAVALDHTDGTGGNARFFNPTGVAVDSAGTIYVADGGDHTIRRVTAGGVVTTFAGTSGQAGSNDGTGTGARFTYPFALAVDATGNLYVTDVGDHTVRKVSAAGVVTTVAGSAGTTGSLDGTGTAARFNNPQGIAVDAAGNIYVSDTGNSTIRKISTGGVVTTFAGTATLTGTADGTGSVARFNFPAGLAVDAAGNVYVADHGSSTIRKINSGGVVTTFAGSGGVSGSVDGTLAAARFDHPTALSIDAAGDIYVIDTSNQTVRKISISGGVVSTLAGSAGLIGKVDGSGGTARFFYPFGIAVTASGTVYVADTGNHSIRTVTAGGSVSTLAGAVGVSGVADGVGGEALFAYPAGLAVDANGTVYVADHNNHTVRKITAAGAVTTLAGSAGISGSADGQGSAARFNGLTGVAVDGSGNVYVADAGNSTIRKITAGGTVTTLAGTAGVAGSADGIGTAARFNAPQGLAVDSTGNVFVADTNNSMIRKISPGGLVTTVAGAPGQVGTNDGVAGGARFNGPYAVAVDTVGNLYVSDFFNSTIRKIDAGGSVTTLAGVAGKPGDVDGAGTVARFNQSYALTVDAGGNVFVADTYNRSIRKITTSGNVSTLNGSLSRFYYPQGIAVDASGNLYVADGDNQAIVKALLVLPPLIATQPTNQSGTVGSSVTLSVAANPLGNSTSTYQWQLNGTNVSGATSATLTINNLQPANAGVYTAVINNVAGSATSNPAVVGVTSTLKIVGTGSEVGSNITLASNGLTYDQILLEGPAATVTADAGQITRISYIDNNNDIVQVEFAGAGSLSLVLEGASGPAAPVNYNQNVNYMKGHATIVIAGANESTNVSVFSVGTLTAVNQALFKPGVTYDGVADIASIAILSSNGKFGGVRTANASYFNTKLWTGVYAPGVQFLGPVYIGDISAFDAATPVILLGSVTDAQVNGGDMFQTNGAAVKVSGITQLKFVAGTTSHNVLLPAQNNRGRFEDNGVDVTNQIVVNP